ncbi:hypothetical protein [Egicoccus sp. AB-alg2]|uniref:hypothetical protein n=1 Tax=Egicoccus sp. AB-alg2 TaxID=3242693 RepID=UPI00359D7AB9
MFGKPRTHVGFVLDDALGARGRMAAVLPHLRSRATVLGPVGVDVPLDAAVEQVPVNGPAEVLAWVARERPDLLFVDGPDSLVLAAALGEVPVATLLRHGERSEERDLVHEVAHGLLAPYPRAFAPRSTGPIDEARVQHVGWLPAPLGPAPSPLPAAGSSDARRTMVVVTGRRGAGVEPADLRAAAAATPGWRWLIAGETTVAPAPGLEPLGVRHDLLAVLRAADAVVAGASLSTVAAVAAADVPMLAVPRSGRRGAEDEFAALLGALGAAVPLHRWPAPEQWDELLDGAARMDRASLREGWDGGSPLRAATALDGWAGAAAGGAPDPDRRARLLAWASAGDLPDVPDALAGAGVPMVGT